MTQQPHRSALLPCYCAAILFQLLAPCIAHSQTLPVMTGYVDVGVGSAGATEASGLDYITQAEIYLVLDRNEVSPDLFRVFIVDAAGTLLAELPVTLPGGQCPAGIAFLPSLGQMAIVDPCSDELYRVDFSGVTQNECDTVPFGSGGPEGVARTSNASQLAIIDEIADEVFIVDLNCGLQSQFDTSSYSNSPTGISYLDGGGFAISDTLQNEVLIVNDAGVLQSNFDTVFLSAFTPEGVADLGGGRIGFVDETKAEIFEVDRRGSLSSQTSCASFGCSSPQGIDYIASIDLFAIVDQGTDELYLVDTAGGLVASCDLSAFSGQATGVAYDPDTDRFLIADGTAKLFAVSGDLTCSLLATYDLRTTGVDITDPEGFARIGGTLVAVSDDVNDAMSIVDLAKWGRRLLQFSTKALGADRPVALHLLGGSFLIADSNTDQIYISSLIGEFQGRLPLSPFGISNPTGVTFNSSTGEVVIIDPSSQEISVLDLPGVIP